jgi:hypothetical protein
MIHLLLSLIVLVVFTHITSVCYYNPGGICFPHHASNFGNDFIVVGSFEFGIWLKSDSFKDNNVLEKIPNWREGTYEYGQTFIDSVYNFELVKAKYSVSV